MCCFIKIRNIKLYQIHSGCIDYNDERLRRSLGSSILNSQRPEFIDIGFNYVKIYYEGSEYSYARPYTIEKVYPAKRKQKSKKETIERYAFRLSFNNPHNKEELYSSIICLSITQNVLFSFFRFFRWFLVKDNLLWFINMFVLILNVVATYFACK